MANNSAKKYFLHVRDVRELKSCKVKIERHNIPEPSTPIPFYRGLDDPASLVIHFRKDEGQHPIFDREDIIVNQEFISKGATPRTSRSRSRRSSRSASTSKRSLSNESKYSDSGTETPLKPGEYRGPSYKNRKRKLKEYVRQKKSRSLSPRSNSSYSRTTTAIKYNEKKNLEHKESKTSSDRKNFYIQHSPHYRDYKSRSPHPRHDEVRSRSIEKDCAYPSYSKAFREKRSRSPSRKFNPFVKKYESDRRSKSPFDENYRDSPRRRVSVDHRPSDKIKADIRSTKRSKLDPKDLFERNKASHRWEDRPSETHSYQRDSRDPLKDSRSLRERSRSPKSSYRDRIVRSRSPLRRSPRRTSERSPRRNSPRYSPRRSSPRRSSRSPTRRGITSKSPQRGSPRRSKGWSSSRNLHSSSSKRGYSPSPQRRDYKREDEFRPKEVDYRSKDSQYRIKKAEYRPRESRYRPHAKSRSPRRNETERSRRSKSPKSKELGYGGLGIHPQYFEGEEFWIPGPIPAPAFIPRGFLHPGVLPRGIPPIIYPRIPLVYPPHMALRPRLPIYNSKFKSKVAASTSTNTGDASSSTQEETVKITEVVEQKKPEEGSSVNISNDSSKNESNDSSKNESNDSSKNESSDNAKTEESPADKSDHPG